MPLVAPALIGLSPFYVLALLRSFRRLPPELYEAAGSRARRRSRSGAGSRCRWFGPSRSRSPARVHRSRWGNFLDPLVYLYNPDLYTLPLGAPLAAHARSGPTTRVLLAGAVIATAPVAGRLRWSLSGTSSTRIAEQGGSADERPRRHGGATKALRGRTTALAGVRPRAWSRRGAARRASARPAAASSTLLRCVAGLEARNAGPIRIGERDVTEPAPRAAQRLDGLPELRPLPAPDRGGEHRLRARRPRRSRSARCASGSLEPRELAGCERAARAAALPALGRRAAAGRARPRARARAGRLPPRRAALEPRRGAPRARRAPSCRRLHARSRRDDGARHARPDRGADARATGSPCFGDGELQQLGTPDQIWREPREPLRRQRSSAPPR